MQSRVMSSSTSMRINKTHPSGLCVMSPSTFIHANQETRRELELQVRTRHQPASLNEPTLYLIEFRVWQFSLALTVALVADT